MCYAVVKVEYKNGTEPAALSEVSDENSLNANIADLKEKSGVKKISVFLPSLVHELVSEWREFRG